MNDFALSLVSLIFGVLATVWVSRYYFKRATDKSLTPYVQSMSALFEGVDSSLRESLKIAYRDTAVTDLLDVQFLIANTGERPIRDVIAPLRMAVPDGCHILDASLLHVAPEGREVSIEHTGQSVCFSFPLLNSGEFFIVKLLFQGRATIDSFKFSITVDDLPPVLPAIRLPFEAIERARRPTVDWGFFWIGSFFVLAGVAIAALVYLQWPELYQSLRVGIFSSFRENWLRLVSAVVALVVALIFLVLGPMICVGTFTDFSFPRRRRFRVPDSLLRRRLFRDLP